VNNGQITVMNADGSGVTPLTSTATTKQDPTWSPDGTKIAFAANSFDVDRQTDREIWVIHGGGVATQLTNNSFEDTYPAWSPDGTKIAYVRGRLPNAGTSAPNIWTMSPTGAGKTNITDTSAVTFDNPAWSPPSRAGPRTWRATPAPRRPAIAGR
jgi:Tol biopolymer transport system component